MERVRAVFNEINRDGPSGKRLEPQRARTREEVQDPRAFKVVLETT
jgi:hypothetical protein